MSFFAEDIFIIIISYCNCKTFLLQCEKAAENGIKNPPQIAQQKQKSPGFGAFQTVDKPAFGSGRKRVCCIEVEKEV